MRRKQKRLWVSFLAGLLSGLMLSLAAWVYTGRPMVCGGEVLVLPLIVKPWPISSGLTSRIKRMFRPLQMN